MNDDRPVNRFGLPRFGDCFTFRPVKFNLGLIGVAGLLVTGCSVPPWNKPQAIKPSVTSVDSAYAVSLSLMEQRADGLWYLMTGQQPFSGRVEEKYPDGQLAAVMTLHDGLRDGPYELWHQFGQKQLEVVFQKGKMSGVGREWYENGRLRREVFYSDGQRKALKEWYADGTQKRLLDWEADGSPRKVADANATLPVLPPRAVGPPAVPPPAANPLKLREAFYGDVVFRGPGGSIISGAFGSDTMVYVKGEDTPFTGRVVDKFPNNKLREEMHVIDGRPHGPWTEWYADGKKQFEIIYDTGKMKSFRLWDPTGKLVNRGEGKPPAAKP